MLAQRQVSAIRFRRSSRGTKSQYALLFHDAASYDMSRDEVSVTPVSTAFTVGYDPTSKLYRLVNPLTGQLADTRSVGVVQIGSSASKTPLISTLGSLYVTKETMRFVFDVNRQAPTPTPSRAAGEELPGPVSREQIQEAIRAASVQSALDTGSLRGQLIAMQAGTGPALNAVDIAQELGLTNDGVLVRAYAPLIALGTPVTPSAPLLAEHWLVAPAGTVKYRS